jgi:hypothetical protein
MDQVQLVQYMVEHLFDWEDRWVGRHNLRGFINNQDHIKNTYENLPGYGGVGFLG